MLERFRPAHAVAALLAATLTFTAPGCSTTAGAAREDGAAAARPGTGTGSASRLPEPAPGRPVDRRTEAFLRDLEQRTFRWFWDTAHPTTHLVPDRWPTPSFSSVAAVGFGLTAYTIGAERGWVTRAQARTRTLETLQFLYDLPQGPQATGVAGYRGFFYHFLDMGTGLRFQTVELSTVDTALLMAGALSSAEYFDGEDPEEVRIRDLADALYRRVEWDWAQPRAPLICMGWYPESGFHTHDYTGYNETMILYLLALGSPTHAVGANAWDAYTATYSWGTYYGQEQLNFGPLFGHHYSHVWVDFAGIKDSFMRQKGIDYAENTRRSTLSQRAYAAANPKKFKGYSDDVWGLTACDGPGDVSYSIDGTMRTFYSYRARGAALGWSDDDGTIAPTAAAGSIPYAPEVVIPTLMTMKKKYGAPLFDRYGFKDSFNPTWNDPDRVREGEYVPRKYWVATDYLGIDQGPILAMLENHRSRFVWMLMRRNPYLVEGLRRAGFTGGWLAEAP